MEFRSPLGATVKQNSFQSCHQQLFSSFPFKAVLLSAEEGSNAEMLKFFKYAIYCLEKMNIEAAASLRILLALHELGRVDPKLRMS